MICTSYGYNVLFSPRVHERTLPLMCWAPSVEYQQSYGVTYFKMTYLWCPLGFGGSVEPGMYVAIPAVNHSVYSTVEFEVRGLTVSIKHLGQRVGMLSDVHLVTTQQSDVHPWWEL